MAYIGKVSISQEWSNLENLIKTQVSGQSAFAFNSSKTYSLQPEKGLCGVCVTSSLPTDLLAGEHIDQDQFGKYEPDGINDIYVRSKENDAVILLSVSEL